MGVKRTAASVKRKKCTFKNDLIYSHGLLPLDSTGRSTCQFCLCFGREGALPADTAAAGSTGGAGASVTLPKKKRAVSRRHLKFDDFSRHRVEEHYAKSHPRQWASYQRAVSQRGRSSKTNDSFFQAERITGHFARRNPLGEDKVVSKAVGDIAERLFSKEEDPAARTSTGLVLQKVSAADDSREEDDDDDDDYLVEQYVVTLPSRATFLRVIDLVSLGLSFVQVAETISQERELFAGGRSILSNVTRRDVTAHTRLIAVLSLEVLSKVLQRSWAYALAADSSAHIGGTSYFCIRVRIPPLSMHDDIYNLHIVAPPICGSHTGECMYNVTSEVLGALDPGSVQS
jgi:hypothetical protein